MRASSASPTGAYAAPRLAPLITAIAMSFILQNVGIAWKGPNYVSLPVGILPHGVIFNNRPLNAYHLGRI